MARTPGFPESNQRSPAKPSVIVPAERILALYNNAHPGKKQYERVAKTVQDWFSEEAKADGWNHISFHADVTGNSGLGALLKKNFK